MQSYKKARDMNALDGHTAKTRAVSFFEFWPSWVMYAPVGFQWIILAVRYGSLTLPFLANPSLRLSGMVGVPKSELMKQATNLASRMILPWTAYVVGDQSPQEQAERLIAQAAEQDIMLPFVCKPDIGCRGVGVKLVETQEQLAPIIQAYPKGSTLLCQKLASYETEAGIFYVKDPQTGISEIVSMTLKTLPRITGDGLRTVGELIKADRRAGRLVHLYYERHQDIWNHILPEGEEIRMIFSASHSKGAIFTDARTSITDELTETIEAIMQGLPDFYYGRLDVKFSDLDSLKNGKTIEIIEINGASSESIHIWDKDTRFFDALKALLWQYRTLFRIGAYHRSQGKTPPTLGDFWRGWRIERNLTKHYPPTD